MQAEDGMRWAASAPRWPSQCPEHTMDDPRWEDLVVQPMCECRKNFHSLTALSANILCILLSRGPDISLFFLICVFIVMSPTVLRVLICGGGCGGPSLAFWLARAGHRVTVREGAQSFSSEFEIMRGDLVRILYDATENDVEYVFGKTVEHFEQDEKSVTVHFSDGKTGTFDILVGADGQGSRIRKAILPPGVDPLRHLGVYLAYWQVPTVASDDKLGRMCHLPGGRIIQTRTHSPSASQANFGIRSNSGELKGITEVSVEKQKEFWSSKFKDVGWVAPRLIEGMKTSEYFYCPEVVQVRTDTWYKGRVVLLADAAYCPSLMTGMAITSALVGAYVLAGEITCNSSDLDKAFANYDATLCPFVDVIQRLPASLLPLFIPETQLAITILHFVAGLISFLRIPDLVARFSKAGRGGWQLPEYPLLD